MAVVGVALLGAVTWYGQWGYLWREWFTSVDHKKIGIMYVILAIVMLLRGFADAIMMITQKALSVGASEGYLPPHHYDQIFTAHGTIMIFFMAMPFVTGVMNYIMPLQIGARDVAFPFLNNFSFWMTVGGAVLTMMSLFVGEFARTGWLAYPPLSGAAYSPGVGVDYYIWGLQVAGVGTTLSGINLIATIVKMRAPGMTMMKMPVFCWTTLASNAIIVTIFPVLTATLALLALDRYVGTHFFTNDFGGNSMMYMNLIWIWGHPEVYVLVLPAFGIYLGGRIHFLRQAAVRLHVDGLRHGGHRPRVLAGLAAPLLHHGLGRQRQRLLRHHDHDHLDPDGGEGVQLAVHHVPRQDPVRDADDLGDGLHPDLRARRVDRRAARGAARRLRPAQQPVPGRAFPQRHHRRRGVRAACGRPVLVPQGVRLQARPVLGKGVVLVLAGRLLDRVHADLHSRPDGRDAPDAAFRGPGRAALS